MSLSGARTVNDPSGTEWTVRPRWRIGPDVRLWRRERDADFEPLSPGAEADDLLAALALILLAAVVIALLTFVVWPLLALAIELLVAIVLVAAGLFARFVLRKPWVVEARTSSGAGRIRYSVRGYRAMLQARDEIAARLASGDHTPTVAGAERI